MTGGELRSSVTMDGISGLLPLSIVEWVEIREKDRRDREHSQGGANERGQREVGGEGAGGIEQEQRFVLNPSVGNGAQPQEFANYRVALARVNGAPL